MDWLRRILRAHARPLAPLPTKVTPRLQVLPVRAVLLDIYGTLLISGCGEVGTVDQEDRSAAMQAAMRACGLPACQDPAAAVARLRTIIEAQHEAARQAGVDYPEVEIREVWQTLLDELWPQGVVAEPPRNIEPPRNAEPGVELEPTVAEQLAVEYEVRINPCWPMPGMEACLASLAEHGMPLGIVSNAQFFTAELFPSLVGNSLIELGFAAEIQYFSYQHRRAKPATYLFELAADALGQRGIAPAEVLYIGNDMLNDIVTAQQVGMRTGLFAGDRRSLRLRQGDPRVGDAEADLVLTGWEELHHCLPARRPGDTENSANE